jgi:hypothetical protein
MTMSMTMTMTSESRVARASRRGDALACIWGALSRGTVNVIASFDEAFDFAA